MLRLKRDRKSGLWYYFVLISLVLFACIEDEPSEVIIKDATVFNDGIYYFSLSSNDNYYLRFYTNGVVVDVSSTGNPSQVSKWLRSDWPDIPIGTYQIVQDSIFFDTYTKGYGILEYKGLIKNEGEQLDLTIYSPVIDNTEMALYEYYSYESLKNWR